MGNGVRVKGRRVPTIDESKRKRIFQNMGTIKERIIREYQQETYSAELAQRICDGKIAGIFSIMKKNRAVRNEIYEDGRLKKEATELLLKLHSFYLNTISPMGEYKVMPKRIAPEYGERVKELMEELKDIDMPFMIRAVEDSLNIIPHVMFGGVRTSRFGTRIAWIGGDVERDTVAPIGLVLSGGSAKGIAYAGFLKALEEEGLWPDFVIGTSVGALAAACFFSGEGIDKIRRTLNPKNLGKIFTPLQGPFMLIASKFRGILGMGFDRYMKKVFGKAKFSSMRDVYIVGTIQNPVQFGKVLIGQGSTINNGLSFSEDIAVWQAVMGSCAIQGIIPPAVIRKRFKAERLVKGEFGVKSDSIILDHIMLEDGSVVEHLPLLSGELIMEKMGKPGLLIAVNLSNMNPASIQNKERIAIARMLIEASRERGAVRKIVKKVRALYLLIKSKVREYFRSTAPMRAYLGFEATYEHNVRQTVNVVKGSGNKILVNLNANGELGGAELIKIKNTEECIEYGYSVGKELCSILLGKEFNKVLEQGDK
ncbi:MAG: patatin-like phospholipase family protein [Methanobacteriota archaeon]|nr:MAG: patatin-like phospholipase family protein [Euryarchaeota archaeon]